MMRSEDPAAMPMGWGASARYVPELHTVTRGLAYAFRYLYIDLYEPQMFFFRTFADFCYKL